MTRILVVEDNEENWDMLSRRLQRRGYEVDHAIDGQQAVTLAASSRPDLILMDVNLPVLDGLQATRQIKAAGHRDHPDHRPHRTRHVRRSREGPAGGL